jgi:ABC-2 type transport system permease protein
VRRLLSAEGLKLRTTRVTFVLLAFTAGLSGLVAGLLVQFDAAEAASANGLAQAAAFWWILVLVLGILLVTNEYRHGTITTTFLAEPRRERVLAAKLAAAMLAAAAFAVAALAAIALVALPWLAATGEELPAAGDSLGAALRVVLTFALAAGLGAGVGAVLQSQVGAIVGALIWLFIVESIIGVVSGLIFTSPGEPDPISPYLPGSALQGIVGEVGDDYLLGPGGAVALSLAYVAAFGALGALAMRRRDPSEG